MSNLICDRIIIFLLMTLVFLHCQQLFEKKNMIYNSGGKEKPVLYKTCAFVVCGCGISAFFRNDLRSVKI